MNNSNELAGQLEVFFDGQCPLCRREIEMIRGWDDSEHILFTDISATEFHAVNETGRSLTVLMQEIHARIIRDEESGNVSTAKWFTGVDVFREMYARIGFQKSVWISKLPIIAQLLQLAYRIFAAIRFRFAKSRISKVSECENGCSWDSKLTNDSNANGVAS